MVDIHSHLLFGVDDGAKTIDESILLLKQAEKIGYTDIVCSSHFYTGRYENENYDKNFEILKKEIEKQKINIKIYKGNEVTFKDEILTKIKNVNTMNDTEYMLVEFKKGLIYSLYKDFLQKLIDMGYKPILAHIERYPFIKFEEFKELYNMGIIFQMNIKSIEALSPKMEYFLKEGYIKIVATDVHHLETRNYDIKNYLEKLENLVGKEKFQELVYENPKKILNNENISLEIKGENNEIKKINSASGLFKFIWNKLFGRA